MAIFLHLCFMFIVASGVLGGGLDDLDVEALVFDPKTPVETKAQNLASDLLKEIHKERHRDLINRIDSIPDSGMDNIKNTLAKSYNDNILREEKTLKKISKELEKGEDLNKLKTKAELETKIEAMKAKRQEIVGSNPQQIKNKLVERITEGSKFDTVAVDVSKGSKELVIAGNVKTRVINDISDQNTKLWHDVVKGETKNSAANNKYSDFGFQDTDAAVIRKVLSKPEFAEFKNYNVDVLTSKFTTENEMLKSMEMESKKIRKEIQGLEAGSKDGLSQQQLEDHNKRLNNLNDKLKKSEALPNEIQKISGEIDDLTQSSDSCALRSK